MANRHSTGRALPTSRDPEDRVIHFELVRRRLAENLGRRRRLADLSQEELGYRASLHRTEISLLERGSRTPRIDTLMRLAGGLECEAAVLLTGISWSAGSLVKKGQFYLDEVL